MVGREYPGGRLEGGDTGKARDKGETETTCIVSGNFLSDRLTK